MRGWSTVVEGWIAMRRFTLKHAECHVPVVRNLQRPVGGSSEEERKDAAG